MRLRLLLIVLRKMHKGTVLVGLSGGVDSAVTVKLLLKEGYKVEGAFMHLVENAGFQEGQKAAQVIAQILQIPFQVFHFEKRFAEEVIQPSLEDYQIGLTPNPCVFCNHRVKFGLFFDEARKRGFDFIATGHYVRKVQAGSSFQLWQARDKNKDQSYFLWWLNQERLARILFPLGNLLRSEVESLSRDWGLSKFIRPASQELCFVKNKMGEFLKKHLGENPGEIVTKEGEVLGKHEGLWFYTIGQRHSLNLLGGPFYVIGKDVRSNRLIVSLSKDDLRKKHFFLRQVNWLSGQEPVLPYQGEVKVRYQATPKTAIITKKKEKYFCQSEQIAVTPGQSAVIYRELEMIGGGLIEN